MKERPRIQDIPGLEKQFRRWCRKKQKNTPNTVNTYWDRIKTFPYFDLQDWPDKPYFESNGIDVIQIKKHNTIREDEGEPPVTDTLIGLIDSTYKDDHQLSALRRYMTFLQYMYKNDPEISSRQATMLKRRKNSVIEDIGDNTTKNKEILAENSIKRHYIHKDDLIRLLREAEPERAKFWALLYYLGCRYGELKRLGHQHFRPEYGDYGAIKILSDRSKSKHDRTVELYSDTPLKLLRDAPVGNWRDETDRLWEDVLFPDVKNDKENYQLGKKVDYNGKEKIYGLVGDVGMSPRTLHSFRHTRITDLVNSDDHHIEDVQSRNGHVDIATTNHYTETDFDVPPQKLEDYCGEKDIDIISVIQE